MVQEPCFDLIVSNKVLVQIHALQSTPLAWDYEPNDPLPAGRAPAGCLMDEEDVAAVLTGCLGNRIDA